MSELIDQPAPPPVPQPGPKPGRRSPWVWIGFGGLGCLLVVVGLMAIGVLGLMQRGTKALTQRKSGDKIGVIHVTGVITGGYNMVGFFGSASGSDSITKMINRAARDDSIKALILRINSPGGSAAASQEIFSELLKLRAETGKPVVVSMSDVAASGGYFIAAGADHIVANPATLTGSIGVIMSIPDYRGLYEKIGLEDRTFTSGEYKDMGSPFRDMTEEELIKFERMMLLIHEQFVEAVAEGRGMDIDETRKLANGEILTGAQAHEMKLVDELGNFQDAVEAARRLADIEGRPNLVNMERPGFLDTFFGPDIRVRLLDNMGVAELTKFANSLYLEPLLERLEY